MYFLLSSKKNCNFVHFRFEIFILKIKTNTLFFIISIFMIYVKSYIKLNNRNKKKWSDFFDTFKNPFLFV